MKTKIFLRVALLSAIMTLSGFGDATLAAPPMGEPVAIVVNKANATGNLSVDEVRKFFMGDKARWDGSKKAVVVMLSPGSAERETVLRAIFKMNESEYNKYSMQAVFTGKMASAPLDLPSPSMIKKFVAANPGAIGYVKKSDADDTVRVICEVN